MFPLSDVTRRPLTTPIVTIGIIAINIVVFFLELSQGDAFVIAWSVKPAEIAAGQNWPTLITAMFMHGGFMHIIGNMVFLWVFGPEMDPHGSDFWNLCHRSDDPRDIPDRFLVFDPVAQRRSDDRSCSRPSRWRCLHGACRWAHLWRGNGAAVCDRTTAVLLTNAVKSDRRVLVLAAL